MLAKDLRAGSPIVRPPDEFTAFFTEPDTTLGVIDESANDVTEGLGRRLDNRRGSAARLFDA